MVILLKHSLKKMVRLRPYNIDSILDYPHKLILLRSIIEKEMINNRVTKLFGIEFPLIQAGMIWCSGWELASAVSNAGGLGIIGAGSMYPEVLKSQIKKCKAATNKPFAVNLPLLYPSIEVSCSNHYRGKDSYCFYFCRKSKKMDISI